MSQVLVELRGRIFGILADQKMCLAKFSTFGQQRELDRHYFESLELFQVSSETIMLMTEILTSRSYGQWSSQSMNDLSNAKHRPEQERLPVLLTG